MGIGRVSGRVGAEASNRRTEPPVRRILTRRVGGGVGDRTRFAVWRFGGRAAEKWAAGDPLDGGDTTRRTRRCTRAAFFNSAPGQTHHRRRRRRTTRCHYAVAPPPVPSRIRAHTHTPPPSVTCASTPETLVHTPPGKWSPVFTL